MARHRHHHHHHHRSYAHNRHHRHNPFGLSANVVRDSAYNAAGALGSMFIANAVNQTGWMDVLATAGSAIGLSFAGKYVGGASTSEELLKGGLTATIIKLLHQAGFAKNLGLGLYAPSWFGVPTASSQYMRAYNANIGPAARGQGTIYIPGPAGTLVPASQLAPGALAPGIGPGGALVAVPPTVSGMGFHRFRSRYAGGY